MNGRMLWLGLGLLGAAGCTNLSARVVQVADESPDVRREAVMDIGSSGRAKRSDKLAELLCLVARSDRDPMVRAAAAQSLGNAKGGQVIETLIYVLANDKSLYARADAARSLGRHTAPEGIDPLLQALRTDPELDVRLAAADALRNYKEPRAAEGLADQVEAPNIALAHTSWVNLRYMTGQDLPRAVAPWREFLASSAKPFRRYGHAPALPQGKSQRPHMTQGVGDFVKDLFKEDSGEAELK